MATKKAKREAGRLKAEQEKVELKARGLAAQQSGRRAEEIERKRMSEFAARMNVRHRETIDRVATASQKAQIQREIDELMGHDHLSPETIIRASRRR